MHPVPAFADHDFERFPTDYTPPVPIAKHHNKRPPARKKWRFLRRFSKLRKTIRRTFAAKPTGRWNHLLFINLNLALLNRPKLQQVVSRRYEGILTRRGVKTYSVGGKMIRAINMKNAIRKYNNAL